jgi:hypothetical protein
MGVSAKYSVNEKEFGVISVVTVGSRKGHRAWLCRSRVAGKGCRWVVGEKRCTCSVQPTPGWSCFNNGGRGPSRDCPKPSGMGLVGIPGKEAWGSLTIDHCSSPREDRCVLHKGLVMVFVRGFRSLAGGVGFHLCSSGANLRVFQQQPGNVQSPDLCSLSCRDSVQLAGPSD